nr:recombinase family protein [Streptococcus cuniculi]
MLEDCRAGKIDLIIVKSVSRFARNQLDFIGICRELKGLANPVGISLKISTLIP